MTRNASLILIMIVSLFVFNLHAEVKNENKPLKGQWDFQLQKMWEVGNAGEDVLVEARVLQVDDDGKVYGNVYVLDMKYFKFFVFSPEGE